MREGPLFDPRDFMIADGIAHLCAGGESACLHRHAAAFSRYLRDKSSGMAGRIAQEAQIGRARGNVARSWGVDAASIGFVGNVAEGVSIVAESLDWRDGDNLVVDANEYPSVVGPFLARRSPRVNLRQARGTAPDRFAEHPSAPRRELVLDAPVAGHDPRRGAGRHAHDDGAALRREGLHGAPLDEIGIEQPDERRFHGRPKRRLNRQILIDAPSTVPLGRASDAP
jgi:hypothetical protein